jgi:hypothetical protein
MYKIIFALAGILVMIIYILQVLALINFGLDNMIKYYDAQENGEKGTFYKYIGILAIVLGVFFLLAIVPAIIYAKGMI